MYEEPAFIQDGELLLPNPCDKETYLAHIAEWQLATGRTGAPPVAYSKKLSNWVQFARAEYKRGKLNEETASRLRRLGIALYDPIDRIATPDPRGLLEVLRHVDAFVSAHGRYPSWYTLDSDERRAAAWCLRLQAGLLPNNWVPAEVKPHYAARIDATLRRVARVQTVHQLAAEWFVFSMFALTWRKLGNLGNRWQGEMIRDGSPMRVENCLGPWMERFHGWSDGKGEPRELMRPSVFAHRMSMAMLAGDAPPERLVTFGQCWPFRVSLEDRVTAAEFADPWRPWPTSDAPRRSTASARRRDRGDSASARV